MVPGPLATEFGPDRSSMTPMRNGLVFCDIAAPATPATSAPAATAVMSVRREKNLIGVSPRTRGLVEVFGGGPGENVIRCAGRVNLARDVVHAAVR
jgi:hypothetical protein